MLILTRKIGERIIIGRGKDAITIEVLEMVDGRYVKLGTEAPANIPVNREEIYVSKFGE